MSRAEAGCNGAWEIRNEFAMVRIARDDAAHDPRLMIQDCQSGQTVFLDALELEALTRVRHGDLRELLDPSGPTAEIEEPDIEEALPHGGS